MKFLGWPKPVLSPPVMLGCGFHSYDICEAVGFWGYWRTREGKWDESKLKHHRPHYNIITKIQLFFLNKCSWVVASINFQHSWKVDFDNICSYGGASFYRSLFHNFGSAFSSMFQKFLKTHFSFIFLIVHLSGWFPLTHFTSHQLSL